MKTIKTIAQLTEYLSNCTKDELNNVYQLLSIPKIEYEKYIFWSDDFYTRNCIVRTEQYELILICWEQNQYTSIHSHGKQECWVYNIEGQFEEIRFVRNENGIPVQKHILLMNKNETSYINDEIAFHTLKNSFNGRSISLHLYAKPINECLVYNKLSQQFELKTLKYHSFNGKLISTNDS